MTEVQCHVVDVLQWQVDNPISCLILTMVNYLYHWLINDFCWVHSGFCCILKCWCHHFSQKGSALIFSHSTQGANILESSRKAMSTLHKFCMLQSMPGDLTVINVIMCIRNFIHQVIVRVSCKNEKSGNDCCKISN